MFLKNIDIFYKTESTHKKFLCKRCMNAFNYEKTLISHKEKCCQHDYCQIKMPIKDSLQSRLKFKNHDFKNRVPFVFYADFEAISTKIDAVPKIDSKESLPKTIKLQEQFPAAVGIYFHSDYPDIVNSFYASHRSEDEVFCNWLIEKEKELSVLLQIIKPLDLTPDEETRFQETKDCYYCSTKLGNDRVGDHDHFSGKFRGASHNNCNLIG